mmetsp:Transcript_60888/g.69632  ORF Transcript_60888/g.69632 Transcript_60888/m.69632 type:complete len:221 (+) Transcript_60888:1-663(+)
MHVLGNEFTRGCGDTQDSVGVLIHYKIGDSVNRIAAISGLTEFQCTSQLEIAVDFVQGLYSHGGTQSAVSYDNTIVHNITGGNIQLLDGLSRNSWSTVISEQLDIEVTDFQITGLDNSGQLLVFFVSDFEFELEACSHQIVGSREGGREFTILSLGQIGPGVAFGFSAGGGQELRSERNTSSLGRIFDSVFHDNTGFIGVNLQRGTDGFRSIIQVPQTDV